MENYNDIWNDVDALKSYRVFDAEEEWNQFIKLIDKRDSAPNKKNTTVVSSKRVSLWQGLAVAASLSLLLTAYFTFFYNPAKFITVVSEASIVDVMLEDGSQVELAPYSTLIYPKGINNLSERKLLLSGNANIKVAPQGNASFQVELENTAIKVIGTQFIIQQLDSSIELENIEGRILFYELANENNRMILNPGDKVRYDQNGFSHQLEKPSSPKLLIKDIMNHLIRISEGKIVPGTILSANSGLYNERAEVEADLTLSLDSLLMQLDSTAQFVLKKGLCQGCFQVVQFLGLKDESSK